MPQIKVTCAFCRRTSFCMSSLRGSAGLAEIAAHLSEEGWSGSVALGAATCSEKCRAAMARNLTPALRVIDEAGSVDWPRLLDQSN